MPPNFLTARAAKPAPFSFTNANPMARAQTQPSQTAPPAVSAQKAAAEDVAADLDLMQAEAELKQVERTEERTADANAMLQSHSFVVDFSVRATGRQLLVTQSVTAPWWQLVSCSYRSYLKSNLTSGDAAKPTCRCFRHSNRSGGAGRVRGQVLGRADDAASGTDVEPEPIACCADAVSCICLRRRKRLCGPFDLDTWLSDAVQACGTLAWVAVPAFLLVLAAFTALHMQLLGSELVVGAIGAGILAFPWLVLLLDGWLHGPAVPSVVLPSVDRTVLSPTDISATGDDSAASENPAGGEDAPAGIKKPAVYVALLKTAAVLRVVVPGAARLMMAAVAHALWPLVSGLALLLTAIAGDRWTAALTRIQTAKPTRPRRLALVVAAAVLISSVAVCSQVDLLHLAARAQQQFATSSAPVAVTDMPVGVIQPVDNLAALPWSSVPAVAASTLLSHTRAMYHTAQGLTSVLAALVHGPQSSASGSDEAVLDTTNPLQLRLLAAVGINLCGYAVVSFMCWAIRVLVLGPLAAVFLLWHAARNTAVADHVSNAAAVLDDTLSAVSSDSRKRSTIVHDRVVKRNTLGCALRLRSSSYYGLCGVCVPRSTAMTPAIALESYCNALNDGVSATVYSFRRLEVAGVRAIGASSSTLLTGRKNSSPFALLLACAPAFAIERARTAEATLRSALCEGHGVFARAAAAVAGSDGAPDTTASSSGSHDAALLLHQTLSQASGYVLDWRARVEGYVRALSAQDPGLVPVHVGAQAVKAKLSAKMEAWRTQITAVKEALQAFKESRGESAPVAAPAPAPASGFGRAFAFGAAAAPAPAAPPAPSEPRLFPEDALEALVIAATEATRCAVEAREARHAMQAGLAGDHHAGQDSSSGSAARSGYNMTTFQLILAAESKLYTACNGVIHELLRSRNLKSAHTLVNRHLQPTLLALRADEEAAGLLRPAMGQGAAEGAVAATGFRLPVVPSSIGNGSVHPQVVACRALQPSLSECTLLQAAWSTHTTQRALLAASVARSILAEVRAAGAAARTDGDSSTAHDVDEDGARLRAALVVPGRVTVIVEAHDKSPFQREVIDRLWPQDCILPTPVGHARERLGWRLSGMVAALRALRAERQNAERLHAALSRSDAELAAQLTSDETARLNISSAAYAFGGAAIKQATAGNPSTAASVLAQRAKAAQMAHMVASMPATMQQAKIAAGQLKLAISRMKQQETDLWRACLDGWGALCLRSAEGLDNAPALALVEGEDGADAAAAGGAILHVQPTGRLAGMAVERYARELLGTDPSVVPHTVRIVLAALPEPGRAAGDEAAAPGLALGDALSLLRDADGSTTEAAARRLAARVAMIWRRRSQHRDKVRQAAVARPLTAAQWRARQSARVTRLWEEIKTTVSGWYGPKRARLALALAQARTSLGVVYARPAMTLGMSPSALGATVGLHAFQLILLAMLGLTAVAYSHGLHLTVWRILALVLSSIAGVGTAIARVTGVARVASTLALKLGLDEDWEEVTFGLQPLWTTLARGTGLMSSAGSHPTFQPLVASLKPVASVAGPLAAGLWYIMTALRFIIVTGALLSSPPAACRQQFAVPLDKLVSLVLAKAEAASHGTAVRIRGDEGAVKKLQAACKRALMELQTAKLAHLRSEIDRSDEASAAESARLVSVTIALPNLMPAAEPDTDAASQTQSVNVTAAEVDALGALATTAWANALSSRAGVAAVTIALFAIEHLASKHLAGYLGRGVLSWALLQHFLLFCSLLASARVSRAAWPYLTARHMASLARQAQLLADGVSAAQLAYAEQAAASNTAELLQQQPGMRAAMEGLVESVSSAGGSTAVARVRRLLNVAGHIVTTVSHMPDEIISIAGSEKGVLPKDERKFMNARHRLKAGLSNIIDALRQTQDRVDGDEPARAYRTESVQVLRRALQAIRAVARECHLLAGEVHASARQVRRPGTSALTMGLAMAAAQDAATAAPRSDRGERLDVAIQLLAEADAALSGTLVESPLFRISNAVFALQADALSAQESRLPVTHRQALAEACNGLIAAWRAVHTSMSLDGPVPWEGSEEAFVKEPALEGLTGFTIPACTSDSTRHAIADAEKAAEELLKMTQAVQRKLRNAGGQEADPGVEVIAAGAATLIDTAKTAAAAVASLASLKAGSDTGEAAKLTSALASAASLVASLHPYVVTGRPGRAADRFQGAAALPAWHVLHTSALLELRPAIIRLGQEVRTAGMCGTAANGIAVEYVDQPEAYRLSNGTSRDTRTPGLGWLLRQTRAGLQSTGLLHVTRSVRRLFRSQDVGSSAGQAVGEAEHKPIPPDTPTALGLLVADGRLLQEDADADSNRRAAEHSIAEDTAEQELQRAIQWDEQDAVDDEALGPVWAAPLLLPVYGWDLALGQTVKGLFDKKTKMGAFLHKMNLCGRAGGHRARAAAAARSVLRQSSVRFRGGASSFAGATPMRGGLGARTPGTANGAFGYASRLGASTAGRGGIPYTPYGGRSFIGETPGTAAGADGLSYRTVPRPAAFPFASPLPNMPQPRFEASPEKGDGYGSPTSPAGQDGAAGLEQQENVPVPQDGTTTAAPAPSSSPLSKPVFSFEAAAFSPRPKLASRRALHESRLGQSTLGQSGFGLGPSALRTSILPGGAVDKASGGGAGLAGFAVPGFDLGLAKPGTTDAAGTTSVPAPPAPPAPAAAPASTAFSFTFGAPAPAISTQEPTDGSVRPLPQAFTRSRSRTAVRRGMDGSVNRVVTSPAGEAVLAVPLTAATIVGGAAAGTGSTRTSLRRSSSRARSASRSRSQLRSVSGAVSPTATADVGGVASKSASRSRSRSRSQGRLAGNKEAVGTGTTVTGFRFGTGAATGGTGAGLLGRELSPIGTVPAGQLRSPQAMVFSPDRTATTAATTGFSFAFFGAGAAGIGAGASSILGGPLGGQAQKTPLWRSRSASAPRSASRRDARTSAHIGSVDMDMDSSPLPKTPAALRNLGRGVMPGPVGGIGLATVAEGREWGGDDGNGSVAGSNAGWGGEDTSSRPAFPTTTTAPAPGLTRAFVVPFSDEPEPAPAAAADTSNMDTGDDSDKEDWELDLHERLARKKRQEARAAAAAAGGAGTGLGLAGRALATKPASASPTPSILRGSTAIRGASQPRIDGVPLRRDPSIPRSVAFADDDRDEDKDVAARFHRSASQASDPSFMRGGRSASAGPSPRSGDRVDVRGHGAFPLSGSVETAAALVASRLVSGGGTGAGATGGFSFSFGLAAGAGATTAAGAMPDNPLSWQDRLRMTTKGGGIGGGDASDDEPWKASAKPMGLLPKPTSLGPKPMSWAPLADPMDEDTLSNHAAALSSSMLASNATVEVAPFGSSPVRGSPPAGGAGSYRHGNQFGLSTVGEDRNEHEESTLEVNFSRDGLNSSGVGASAAAASAAAAEDLAFALQFAKDAATAVAEAEERERKRREEEGRAKAAAESAKAQSEAAAASAAAAASVAAAAAAAAPKASPTATPLAAAAASAAVSSSGDFEADAVALVKAFEDTQAAAANFVRIGGLLQTTTGRPATARDPLGFGGSLGNRPQDDWTNKEVCRKVRPLMVNLAAVRETVLEQSQALGLVLQAAWSQDIQASSLPAGADVSSPSQGVQAVAACGPQFVYACDFLISLLCDQAQPKLDTSTASSAGGEEELSTRDAKLYAIANVFARLFVVFHKTATGVDGQPVDLGVRFRSRYLAFMYQGCPALVPTARVLSGVKGCLAATIYGNPDGVDRMKWNVMRTLVTVHCAVMQTRVTAAGVVDAHGQPRDFNPLGVGCAWVLMAKILNRLVNAPSLGSSGVESTRGALLSSIGSAQASSMVLALILDIAGWALSQPTPPAAGHQFVKAMEVLYRAGVRLVKSMGPSVEAFPEVNRIVGLLEDRSGHGGPRFNPAKVLNNRPPELKSKSELDQQ